MYRRRCIIGFLLCLIFHFVRPHHNSETSPSVGEIDNGVAKTKLWKFKVKYEPKHAEKVCITGDCDALGNWTTKKKTIALSYGDGSTNLWSVTANIPADRDVRYRYFTCIFDVVDEQIKIKIEQWETNLHPRKLEQEKIANDSNEVHDVFGIIDSERKLENGWLVDDVAVLIRVNSTSIEWITEKASQRKTLIKLRGSTRDQNDGDLAKNSRPDIILISTRNEDGKYREQLGSDEYYSYYDNERVVFMTRTFTSDNQGFVFELKDYVEGHPLREYYSHLVLDQEFGGSRGNKKITIHSSDQKHVGNLNVNYLIVRPAPQDRLDLTFKSSFAKYWNNSWTCLEIGHRGAGKSFSKSMTGVLLNSQYRENTIGSFKSAGTCGAHLVEFDVQLTSDLVPTVFHDFNLLLELRGQTENSKATLNVPFYELSFENLKDFKIRHVREKDGLITFENDDGEESIPFPSLKQVMNSVDPHIGFNIEIKHTSQSQDDEILENPIDMNTYVDRVLEVVFENAGLRYIVFSSFSADICLMARLKQNKYPVMFLTNSVKKPTPSSEERVKNIQSAIDFANSADLLGIVAEAKDLLHDPTLVKMISNSDLIPFSWGEDVNNNENIETLKKNGIQGVIFDGIDRFGQKLKNDIIFSEGIL